MKILEKDYLEAKRIVEEYQEQLKQDRGEHYCVSSGGKWSSQGQMKCIDCGKTIG